MAPELWPNDELTRLANRYSSDKGTTYNCAHGYTRVYQALLAPLRTTPLRMLEIGLVHGQVQAERPQDIDQLACPSLRMWSDYLPKAEIHGLDIVDFTRFTNPRATVWQADQGSRAELDAVAAKVGGKFDVIIDDGSHASHHQQVSLAALFRHVADGGLYVIEDLHYQPAGLELPNITLTRDFLRGLAERRPGMRLAIDQAEFAYLVEHVQSIQFFDSISPRWPLAVSADALAVIRKKGRHPVIPPVC
jgi:hypothetical protein